MKKLGDLFEFVNGRGFKKTEWRTSGLPIIRIQNLNNTELGFNYFDGAYNKKIEVNKGDLLFSWSGTVGSSFGPHVWMREKGVLNQHIFKLKFKDSINRDYAFYGLKYITADIEKRVNGAVGLVHITKKKLNQFKIPLPPLPEQKHIVAILDKTFTAIAKVKANAEQNLKNAKELFESYLQSVFENKGEGWEVEKMKNVCNLITCGVAARPEYVDEGVGVPFLSAQNVKNGIVVLDKYKYISKEFHQQLTKKNKPRKGDILYSRVGAKYGEAGVVEHSFEFSVYVSLTLIKPNPEKLNSYYLKYCLNSKRVKALAKASLQSSGVPNLNVKSVREFVVSFPESKVKQEAIVQKLDALSTETKKLEATYLQKTNNLEELKKSILQKAFNGELVYSPIKELEVAT